MKKINPVSFPLSTQAGRVALLMGLVNGTVKKAELRAAIIQDTEKRPYCKPIVAEGKRFDSVIDAAHWLYRTTPASHGTKHADHHAVIARIRKRIAKWATADNVPGYFWTE